MAEQHLDAGERITATPVTFDEFVEIALGEKFYEMEIKLKLLEAKADPKKMDEIRRLFLER